jgi:hypothetical protein
VAWDVTVNTNFAIEKGFFPFNFSGFLNLYGGRLKIVSSDGGAYGAVELDLEWSSSLTPKRWTYDHG